MCGGHTFHPLAGVMTVNGADVSQEYHTILRNGYALAFVLCWVEGVGDYDELKKTMETVQLA